MVRLYLTLIPLHAPPAQKGSCNEAGIASPLLVVARGGVSTSGVAASLLAWQVEQGLICEAQAVSWWWWTGGGGVPLPSHLTGVMLPSHLALGQRCPAS